MKLQDYFEENSGRGILSTADRDGNVDAAVYASPHILENEQVAFIMRERLSHKNLEENPRAAYLFMKDGKGYSGLRLYLEKTGEECDTPRVEELRKRKRSCEEDEELGPKHLVYFKVTKILPLVGRGDPGVTL